MKLKKNQPNQQRVLENLLLTVGKGIPTKLRPFVIFEFMENEWEFMKSSY